MADLAVPIVLENLIKLGTYEVYLLLGVKDQVRLLESDLRFIKVFLESTDRKRNDPMVTELVDQIRDAALDSEDAIDTYVARVIRERRRNLLGKLFHCVGRAMDLHGVSNQMSSIKNIMMNIYQNKEKYGIGDADQPSVVDEAAEQSIERRRRNVEEVDVVGFDKETTTLINWLTNQSNLQRDVISIVGMGGLGKTTLARKIYNNSSVKDHFYRRGWISVSQQWQTRSLLLDLLQNFEQITQKTSEKTVEELKGKLREQLKNKRYLVVMDDIWSTQVWEEVRVAFPDDSNGSRILITTRIRAVALHASPTHPQDLQPLDENESWELLKKKVFQGSTFHHDLEEPGKNIAKSCGGLPLSIVLLGSMLAAEEKSDRVWSRFAANVNSHLKQGISIVKLSYNDLPRELKLCFLYLGLFPEDSEIVVKDLMELWIGEGFIRSDRSTSIYDVAEDYLEKLIDRSMIQIARKRLDGGVKTFRIHDLLRDFCIAESRRDKFFDIYSTDNNVSFNRKSRRLSIQCHISYESPNFDLSSSCARSVLFFGVDHNPLSKSGWKQIYKWTKFIRVLFLFRLEIEKIPSQIEELIFLRCLVLKCCDVEYISTSIWNFRYLETVRLEHNLIGRFPKGIWSVMKDLRCLYMDSDDRTVDSSLASEMNLDLSDIPPRSLMGLFGTSKKFNGPFLNLQVLSWVKVKQNTALVIAKFPNLRKLGFIFRETIEECEVESIMESVRRLKSLQSLKIRFDRTPSKKVRTRLNSLPSALTKISWTSYDPLDLEIFKDLAKQPHLRVLKINLWANSAQQLPDKFRVVAGGFPQLQVLKLSNLGIKTWEMDKDAMPKLESLFIVNCECLEYLPEDELLCRSALQLVQVEAGKWRGRVTDKLKTMLTDFKIKYPDATCKINIIDRGSA